ncbi:MAG: 3-isopropylmalate dehydratase large subunit [Chloroflexi bacterium CG_4_9_14_3_um_filter_45_9]|nr:MAG: 3-isopropylmalate dehydratase large subunit [Dehalococcoidia bacterium CG2_30_46_9]PIU23222.1 MAG: 3-isopropylmalate dehydratase large subunit [Chloroflexi bacterium CG08_land_8_20_14_0_20_45_12]PIX27024.1 MAG: 3-isopropylmalate dehydratase large subunit [Chloroflexi bacterium CG_4_8_14_3_um_filter_45_15]PJB50247.1 MAG: 3-isopropylmalate dehydratase large subunit [Chloroflexi bacterium CG_4_9_14_3_um_filter_45_9]
MTLAEKVLSAHCDKKEVRPGEFINARVDLILANDITAPLAIKEFLRFGIHRVFNPAKVVMVPDHFCPNKDIPSAEQAKLMRGFAREQGLIYFEVGRMGIEHVLLPEQGLVLPGQVIVGADSHTCTYGALGAFATGMGSTDIAVAMAMGEIWMKVPPTIKFVYQGRLPEWIGGKDLILYTIGNIGVDGALYSAMEFTGEAIDELSMDGRFTMANMAIEAGAKAGIFHVDGKTKEYIKEHASSHQPYSILNQVQDQSDEDAEYTKIIEYDVSKFEPQVAFPHLPSNTKPISQVGDIKLDQVVIGSCTNGRLDDLRVAAKLLKGRQIHPELRCIIIPGSQRVYLEALREGLIEVFIEAGAAVSTPTCGPCLGGYMGVLAAGERCLSTTNRNFIGRMGSPESEVYLASPAVAAASAILGRIASPEEFLS